MSVIESPFEIKMSNKDKQMVREYIEFEIEETACKLEEIKRYANNSLIYSHAEMFMEKEELIGILRKRAYDEDGNIRPKLFFKVLDYLKDVAEEDGIDL